MTRLTRTATHTSYRTHLRGAEPEGKEEEGLEEGEEEARGP